MTSEHILLVWGQCHFLKWRRASAFATRVMLSTARAQRLEGGPGPSAVIGDPQAVHTAFSRRNRGALWARYCTELKASGSGRISGRPDEPSVLGVESREWKFDRMQRLAGLRNCTSFSALMEISSSALILHYNASIDTGVPTE